MSVYVEVKADKTVLVYRQLDTYHLVIGSMDCVKHIILTLVYACDNYKLSLKE